LTWIKPAKAQGVKCAKDQLRPGSYIEGYPCGIDLKSNASRFELMGLGQIRAYVRQVGREIHTTDLTGTIERLVHRAHRVQALSDMIQFAPRLAAPLANHEPKQGLDALEVVLDPVTGRNKQPPTVSSPRGVAASRASQAVPVPTVAMRATEQTGPERVH
jgi:hypothetical protein